MREFSVVNDWRTIQFFLDDQGVYEVEADPENNKNVRCTCSSFKRSSKCKHTKYVQAVTSENNGLYTIRIAADLDEEEMRAAMDDPPAFREIIMKHTKPVVLP